MMITMIQSKAKMFLHRKDKMKEWINKVICDMQVAIYKQEGKCYLLSYANKQELLGIQENKDD